MLCSCIIQAGNFLLTTTIIFKIILFIKQIRHFDLQKFEHAVYKLTEASGIAVVSVTAVALLELLARIQRQGVTKFFDEFFA